MPLVLNFSSAAENKAAIGALRSLHQSLESRFNQIALDLTAYVSNEDETVFRKAHAQMVALGKGIMSIYPARPAGYEPGVLFKAFLLDVVQMAPAAIHMGFGHLSSRKTAHDFTVAILAANNTLQAFWDKEIDDIAAISDMDDALKEMIYGTDLEQYWPDIIEATDDVASQMRGLLPAMPQMSVFNTLQPGLK